MTHDTQHSHVCVCVSVCVVAVDAVCVSVLLCVYVSVYVSICRCYHRTWWAVHCLTLLRSHSMKHFRFTHNHAVVATNNTLSTLLSVQCISSIGQIIMSVSVSVSQSVSEWVSLSQKTSWTLYRSQSSTDLHQTCHQGRVPGAVVTYSFWWKS